MLDVEPTENPAAWGGSDPSGSELVVRAFVTHTKEAFAILDARLMLYDSLGWLRGQFGDDLSNLTTMPVWAARYDPALGGTSPGLNATIWQDFESGIAQGSGAPGMLDLDVWLDEAARA